MKRIFYATKSIGFLEPNRIRPYLFDFDIKNIEHPKDIGTLPTNIIEGDHIVIPQHKCICPKENFMWNGKGCTCGGV